MLIKYDLNAQHGDVGLYNKSGLCSTFISHKVCKM